MDQQTQRVLTHLVSSFSWVEKTDNCAIFWFGSGTRQRTLFSFLQKIYQNDKLLVAPKLTLLSDREGTFIIGSDAEKIEVTTKISEVQGSKNTYRLVSSLVINDQNLVRIQQNIAVGNSFSFEAPKYKIIGEFKRSKP